MPNSPASRRYPGRRPGALLTISAALSLVAAGATVTSIALRTRHVARTTAVAQPVSRPATRSEAAPPARSQTRRADRPDCRYLPANPATTDGNETNTTNSAGGRVPSTGSDQRTGGAPPDAARPVPPPDARPALPASLPVTLRTNLGEITMLLSARDAPCAVNAVLTLARAGFYTGTGCHQLTSDARWLLRCGDPTGTGAGGPGYRYADEHLPTGHPTYPRGTVAMVNAAPDTNGSQFLIAYRDTDTEPYYPVIGRVTAGMEIVDAVAASGTDTGALDGRPARELRIDAITVGE